MRPLSYSFHDSLGLRVEAGEPEVRDHYAAEYAYHAGAPPDGAPLVRLVSAGPGEGSRSHQHKLLARWKGRISLGGRDVVIEAGGNRLSIPMVHHMMVHPCLRLLASRGGELLLHAASVARDGRSLILTGAGGAGKTTLSALLLEQGGADWQIHGDDYTFLAPGRRTYAYLTRSHLYRNLIAWVPAVRARLTAGERLRLELLGRIRHWSGERIKWPVRVPAGRLWPGRGVCREARLAGVVLLRRGRADRPGLVPADDVEEVFDRLIEMNFEEARHFIRIAWEGDDGAPDLQRWRSLERRSIESLCAGIPIYWLELPPGGPQPGHARLLLDLLGPVIDSRM